MLKGYIYKYTYSNGKVYIGQTTDLEKRHYQHMYASGGKIKRQVCEIAIAKYGEPTLEVLEEIVEENGKPYKFHELLNDAERKWIKIYDSTNKEKGYNIQCGGHRVNEEEFILEEVHAEILQTKADELFRIKDLLDSIVSKVESDEMLNSGCMPQINEIDLSNPGYNLTLEEKDLWFNYKFRDYYGTIITFDFFIKHLPILDDFKNVVNYVFDMFLMDVSERAWKDIENNKEKYINDYFTNNFSKNS